MTIEPVNVGPPANFRNMVHRQIARVRGVDISELSFADELQVDRRFHPDHEVRGSRYEAGCMKWEAMTAEEIWGPTPSAAAPDAL